MALIQFDWCVYKKGKYGHRYTTEKEHHVKMEAEIRVDLQAKEYQKLPPNHQKLRESKKQISSSPTRL